MKATTKWLTFAVPAAVLAMGGLTACGDDGAAQNATWAQNLCSAAQSPIAQAQSALSDTGQVNQGESPSALQKRLAGDMGTLAAANTKLAAAVDSAGAPKVSNGQQLQQQAAQELKQAASGYQTVQQKVLQLPTGDQAKFAAGLKSISDQVQQLSQQSSSALNSLQTGKLGEAVQGQQGCKSAPSAVASSSAGSSAGSSAAGSSGGSSGASASASASSSAH